MCLNISILIELDKLILAGSKWDIQQMILKIIKKN
jgi:hypothetical protein